MRNLVFVCLIFLFLKLVIFVVYLDYLLVCYILYSNVDRVNYEFVK